MRILMHPGFHKTGTSTLQACLAANRGLLAPYCRIVLEGELRLPLRHATRYCTQQDPLDLASFTASFAEICVELARERPRTLVISCEGLSGRTPGKKGIANYGAAIDLARGMFTAVVAVFGRKTEQTMLYTTRNAEAWLWSAWRHNLWGYRVTDDFASFRQTHARAADFAAITESIAAALPRVNLITAALEDIGATGHPVDPILNLLDLPANVTAQISFPTPRNTGRSAELSAALLALNRSDLDDAALLSRKHALLAENPGKETED